MNSVKEDLSGKSVVGIDIGGANLKFAFGSNHMVSLPFAMWNHSRQLSDTIQHTLIKHGADASSCLALTMTGELADCFLTRAEGVRSILEQVIGFHPTERVKVYSVDGNWLNPTDGTNNPWAVAASNWHALASWVIQTGNDRWGTPDLLVDIGSTTVDVIPFHAGAIATNAKTDRQRLQAGQLIYTGVERTPIAAIVRSLTIDNSACPVMAERFADSLDAYLCLGAIETNDNFDTADGRPRTRRFAKARLARMVGEDESTLTDLVITDLAAQVVETQKQQILSAIDRNLVKTKQPTVLFTGHGDYLEKLVRGDLQAKNIICYSLTDHLSQDASRCATALAVSELLQLHQAGLHK